MISRPISRRRLLQGAGSIAVGLPLVPELLANEARAEGAPTAAPETPRLITFFYGNGVPQEFVTDGWKSPVLAPLAPLAPKLTMIRGIDNRACRGGAGNEHTEGAATFAIGRGSDNVDTAGGISLDIAAAEYFKPQTRLSSLQTALFNQDNFGSVRFVKSWAGVGKPLPGIRRPLDLFHRVFGGRETLGARTDTLRAQRQRMSVLDTVLSRYRALAGPASPYSSAARTILNDHLDHVRTLEKRALADHQAVLQSSGWACTPPPQPPDLTPTQPCQGECDQVGFANAEPTWENVFRLNADIYALALKCDLVRFGSMVFTGGGDRFNLFGLAQNSHEIGHAWRANAENGFDRSYIWLMEGLAYFLKALDDPASKDASDRTMLDRTLVFIGTDISNPATHSLDGLSFYLAGGGNFQRGVFDHPRKTEVDLLNGVAQKIGLPGTFGDERYLNAALAL